MVLSSQKKNTCNSTERSVESLAKDVHCLHATGPCRQGPFVRPKDRALEIRR